MHKGDEPPDRDKPPDRPRGVIRPQDLFRLLTFGWYFASSLGVGIVAGIFLDRWLGTEPLFLLLGLLLGSIVGFYGMYRMLRPLYDRDRR